VRGDIDMLEEAFNHSTFSNNRERLLEHDVEAWASLKSFRPKDEKPEHRRPPDDPGKPDRELPRREAQQRNACVADESGVQAVPEEP